MEIIVPLLALTLTFLLFDSIAIATAAMEMLGGKEAIASCRTDQIMADAAYVLLTRDSRARTGEFLIDEDVLKEVGVTDFEQYSCVPGMHGGRGCGGRG